MKESITSEYRDHEKLLIRNKSNIFSCALPFIIAVVVYYRMMTADYGFSYDYPHYIRIIDSLSSLSFSEMISKNLVIPYIYLQGIISVEIGFGLLVKAISITGASAKVTIAIIAAFSVGLRVHVMQSLGAPILWIALINLFAITLFEANAIRLGICSSTLLLGLRNIYWSRRISGSLAIAASISFHFQAILFIIPFAALYILITPETNSKIRIYLTLFFMIAFEIIAIKLIPLISNQKLQEYVTRGTSSSAGLTITSVIALLLFSTVAFILIHKEKRNSCSYFFKLILLSSIPSLLLFLMVTNIAVIGDRSWQLAFIIFTSFFFIDWAPYRLKLIPLTLLFFLMITSLLNVLIRYPLSNFFSPPLQYFTF